MNKLISLLLIELTLISPAMAKIQDADVKSLSEVGSVASRLINDTKIYDSTNGQQLSTSIATGALGGGSSGATKNYVKNPGAESNTTDVTASGSATVTRNTTTPLYGSGDFSITLPNNATDYVEWTLNTLDNALKNQNCELDFYYTASSIGSAVKFEVLQGSNVVIRSDLLAVNSNPQLVKINVPCGDLSGASKVRVTNQTGNSGTSAIKVDQVIYGAATNIGSVSQAEMFGVVTLNSCSGGGLSTPSTSYTTVSSSGCSYTAEGKASAPPSNTFGASFTGLPSGEYEIETDGTVYNSTTDACYARFTDGTNFSQELYYRAAGQLYVPKIGGRFRYDSSKGALNIQLQLKAGGTNTCTLFAPSQFRIKRFPTSSEIAYRPELQALSWSGEHGSDCAWSSTATSPADPSGDSTCTFTERTNKNFGTVTSAQSGGDNIPGFVFSPKKTGDMYVSAVCMGGNGSANFSKLTLTDGTTPIGRSAQPTSDSIYKAEGIYTVADMSSKTIKAQFSSGAGTMTIAGGSSGGGYPACTWTAYYINQNIPAPVLMGGIGVGYAGTFSPIRMEYARLDSVCNVNGNCTVTDKTDGVSSVTRSATGTYAINFSPAFSGVMLCSPESDGHTYKNGTATTSSYGWITTNVAGTNQDFQRNEILCWGVR